jgi:hypothetical protein
MRPKQRKHDREKLQTFRIRSCARHRQQRDAIADENLVTLRDIDVPFWRIVMILVKWSIASIPAMIILMLLASCSAPSWEGC